MCYFVPVFLYTLVWLCLSVCMYSCVPLPLICMYSSVRYIHLFVCTLLCLSVSGCIYYCVPIYVHVSTYVSGFM